MRAARTAHHRHPLPLAHDTELQKWDNDTSRYREKTGLTSYGCPGQIDTLIEEFEEFDMHVCDALSWDL